MAKEKKVVPIVEEDDSGPKSEVLEEDVEKKPAAGSDEDEIFDEDDLEDESAE